MKIITRPCPEAGVFRKDKGVVSVLKRAASVDSDQTAFCATGDGAETRRVLFPYSNTAVTKPTEKLWVWPVPIPTWPPWAGEVTPGRIWRFLETTWADSVETATREITQWKAVMHTSPSLGTPLRAAAAAAGPWRYRWRWRWEALDPGTNSHLSLSKTFRRVADDSSYNNSPSKSGHI